MLRALVPTQLHNGKPVSQVAANVRLASKTVHDIGRRYQDGDAQTLTATTHQYLPPRNSPASSSSFLRPAHCEARETVKSFCEIAQVLFGMKAGAGS